MFLEILAVEQMVKYCDKNGVIEMNNYREQNFDGSGMFPKNKLKGLFVLGEEHFENIYKSNTKAAIASLVNIYGPLQTQDSLAKNNSILEDADIIFSGWGMATMDKAFLDAAPNLKAVFYAAGSVKCFITDYVWDRNIIICSAYAANAIPVAEFTLSQILSCLKRQFHFAMKARNEKTYKPSQCFCPGAYKSTIGIISLGQVSRHLIKLLKSFDINIFLYDTYVDKCAATQLGVTLAGLEEIFQNCDVVSLHSALNETTKNMIRGNHFKLMKYGSSFINTSRGAIVCEKEMIEVLGKRNDITAMLDVTDPEPPLPDSPLYALPNVFLTPHIAGSVGGECARMADYMFEECERFVNGQALKYQITREQLAYLA
jgi:phosphoglycerate dehydrogenase-like enzyme